jgi:diketogulonate reductase-like aldo/keto reductase
MSAALETKRVDLNNGKSMPGIGIGSFDGFKHTPEMLEQFKEATYNALKTGYRLVDCADVYNNEESVGDGIQKFLKEGNVSRGDLFVTSKVFIYNHARDNVRAAVRRSLDRLKLDYLDLYLIHWPAAMKKSPEGVDSPAGIPLADTWKYLEEMVDEGLLRSIGVSNCESRHLNEILTSCRIKPVINQVECHPFLNQEKLLSFCQQHGIVLEAYSPLCKSGANYPSKVDLLNNEVMLRIAKKHNFTVAQVALKWQVQRGVVVIPKSVTPSRVLENISLANLVLDKQDMDDIRALNIGYRLVNPPFMQFIE